LWCIIIFTYINPAPFQSKVPSGTVACVESNRQWFGNVRVVCYVLLIHHVFVIVKISQFILAFLGLLISTQEIPKTTWKGQ
jgi:hypothetical protein